ncbi:MAG: HisA/HisF-related TIM barrel protein, partial [Actinomycetota bacterium]|nr:HisA/HisF-related TIM barrel protein [Actinomycetota bacterium]
DRAGWRVHVEAGRTRTELDAVEWSVRAAELGAGEILLTSIDRDGTGEGYDLELLRKVSGAAPVPLVASGGAGRLEHFAEAFTTGGADAVLAASRFHFGDLSLAQVKEYLSRRGIPVRM